MNASRTVLSVRKAITMALLAAVCSISFADTEYIWRSSSSDTGNIRKLIVDGDERSVVIHDSSYSLSDDSIAIPKIVLIKDSNGAGTGQINFSDDENSAPEGSKVSKFGFAMINESGEVLAIGFKDSQLQFEAFESLSIFRSKYYYENNTFYEIDRDSDQMVLGKAFDLRGNFKADYQTSSNTCNGYSSNARFRQIPSSCNVVQNIIAHRDHAFYTNIGDRSYQAYPDAVRGQIANCGVHQIKNNANPYTFDFSYDTYVIESTCESKSISEDSLNHNIAAAGLYGSTSVQISGPRLDNIGKLTVAINSGNSNESSWIDDVISTRFGKIYRDATSSGDLDLGLADLYFASSGNPYDAVTINGELSDQRGYNQITPAVFFRGTSLDDNILCFETSFNGNRQSIVGNIIERNDDELNMGEGYGETYKDFCRVLIDHEKEVNNQRLFYFPALGSAISIAVDENQTVTGWVPSIVQSSGIGAKEYVESRGSYIAITPQQITGIELTSLDFIAGVINVYEK